jgi:hypothetical protein
MILQSFWDKACYQAWRVKCVTSKVKCKEEVEQHIYIYAKVKQERDIKG